MPTLFTIGHSTRDANAFRDLLAAYQVARLVDIRMFPASRRFPHFNARALAASLEETGLDYRHELALGGRRRGGPESINLFWRNASFRAYADYMATSDFDEALGRLVTLAIERPTAIMCAEAVPWRCHRWLVSDGLVARGVDVVHILDAAHAEPHVLNLAARIDEHGKLSYPAALDVTPTLARTKRSRAAVVDPQARLAFDARARQHPED